MGFKLNQEYINKKNYEFNKTPKNLKYKLDNKEECIGLWENDLFEVYIVYKDNKEYLAFQSYLNIEIYSLLYNEKNAFLEGHKNHIKTIRYFINKKDFQNT